MRNHIPLTASLLRELLDYNSETGEFSRLGKIDGRHRRMGTVRKHRYCEYYVHYISVAGKQYLAHRLAHLWMKGEWPTAETDHINRNPLDNRWANLRFGVTRSDNMLNTGKRKDNTTGTTGVYRNKPWEAQFRGKRLGRFWTKKEAIAAVDKARYEYGHSVGQPARSDDPPRMEGIEPAVETGVNR